MVVDEPTSYFRFDGLASTSTSHWNTFKTAIHFFWTILGQAIEVLHMKRQDHGVVDVLHDAVKRSLGIDINFNEFLAVLYAGSHLGFVSIVKTKFEGRDTHFGYYVELKCRLVRCNTSNGLGYDIYRDAPCPTMEEDIVCSLCSLTLHEVWEGCYHTFTERIYEIASLRGKSRDADMLNTLEVMRRTRNSSHFGRPDTIVMSPTTFAQMSECRPPSLIMQENRNRMPSWIQGKAKKEKSDEKRQRKLDRIKKSIAKIHRRYEKKSVKKS